MKLFIFTVCTIIIAIISIAQTVNAEVVRYDNYKVYKIKFTTEEQFEFLYDLKINSTDVSVWQLSRAQKYADIMVSPEKNDEFLKMLDEHQFRYELKINNVQNLIDRERSGQ